MQLETQDKVQLFTKLFSAFADPSRATILLMLRDGEKRSGDMPEVLGISASAVSHQLRWLRENNIVTGRKEGREVYYQLADACICEIIDVALRHIQEGNLK